MSSEPAIPWRSRPVFRGDDWYELRDAQYDEREGDVAVMAGRVVDMYLRASVVMAREDDPVAEALRAGPYLDLRSLMVAHAHLAGFWRLTNGHVDATLPGIIDLRPLLSAWRNWLLHTATIWILNHPILVRRTALAARWSRPPTPSWPKWTSGMRSRRSIRCLRRLRATSSTTPPRIHRTADRVRGIASRSGSGAITFRIVTTDSTVV